MPQVTEALEAAREVVLSAHYANGAIQMEPRSFNRLVAALEELGLISEMPIEHEMPSAFRRLMKQDLATLPAQVLQ